MDGLFFKYQSRTNRNSLCRMRLTTQQTIVRFHSSRCHLTHSSSNNRAFKDIRNNIQWLHIQWSKIYSSKYKSTNPYPNNNPNSNSPKTSKWTPRSITNSNSSTTPDKAVRTVKWTFLSKNSGIISKINWKLPIISSLITTHICSTIPITLHNILRNSVYSLPINQKNRTSFYRS